MMGGGYMNLAHTLLDLIADFGNQQILQSHAVDLIKV